MVSEFASKIAVIVSFVSILKTTVSELFKICNIVTCSKVSYKYKTLVQYIDYDGQWSKLRFYT